MALTDAQAKIINQNRQKKNQNKQKAAKNTPAVGAGSLKIGTGTASALSPLELARKDAATKTTVKDKVNYAKQSGASTNTKKSIQANQKKQEEKKQARSSLTLSESDLKLPSLSQKGILDAKVAWEEAKKAGDKEGMAKAHADAEKIRSRYGYSGGSSGSEKIEGPGLTEKDKVTLNKTGQQALLSALTLGNKERAEEIRNAKGFQAVDHSQQKDGEGRTIFTQTKEEREKAGKQALAGLEAAGKGFAGSLLSVHETFNQAMRNYQQERWQGKPNGQATIVDPMLPGQRLLRESQEATAEALEGKEGLSALLTKAGISGAQMLPGLAASFIPGVGPAVGATLLGAQAAGSKMGELNEQSSDARLLSYMIGGDPKDYGEVTPQEAFTRGVISGGIEGLTERIPIKGLLKIVKGNGGANFLVNIAKQAGTEATEESASTVLNHLADLAAKDPNASLTLGEVAEAAAVGAISGAGFGAAGTAINSAIGKNQQKTGQETLLETAGVRTPETQQNAPERTFEQPQQETPVQAEMPVQEQERGEGVTETFAEPSEPVAPPSEPVDQESQAEFEAMGAMSRGGAGEFARWQAERENFHPISQEGAERSAELHGRAAVEFPTRDPQGRLTSKTVSTLANASISNNQLVNSLEEDAAAGGYSYRAYSDKEALAKAEDRIRAVGFQRAKEEWIAEARAGKLSKDNTAMGLALINNAANSGTLEGHIDAHDLIGDYISYARTAGQALQAMNMVNRMTPTGQLYTLIKTTENLELNIKNRSGKDVDITIDPDLSRRFMEAQTQEERNSIKQEIYKDVAAQIPNTWKDKADAWRYLAMLGNPRTHIRNIFGNLFFDPVRVTKNVIGAGLESLASRDNRTKAVTTRLSAEDRARQLAGKADFLEVQDAVMSGGKYNDDWSQIDEQRTIFKNPLLESARKGNTKALEAEDRFFSRRAYADSLAGYLKANGITAEEYLSPIFDVQAKEKARQYAIREAQKATYRDLNAASELTTSLGQFKRSNKTFNRAVGYLVEGVVPFKKTPTNIAVRAFEYSPAGLVKGLADAATKVRNNDMSAAEAIDEIASGLTGTGLLALGAALGAAGFVTGGASGDDKQDDFDELQGHQNYAFEVGDTSYTIDWLAPEALPFFVGVELQKFYSGLKTGETERADWAKAAGRIMEPMLEMSMLQSLNDVINSVGSDVPLVSSVASAAMSYLGQFVPTIGGQIERTFLEDTRQQTVVDKESAVPTSVQYMLGAIGNKIPIPGVDFYQEEYVDAWGRTESTGNMARRAFSNFLSPGYLSKLSTTDVDTELQRLYDGDYTSVFPGEFDKALEITTNEANKEKRILTAAERKKAQATRGQTAMDILAGAMGSDVYRSMTDAEKAKFVERVHDYSKAVARIEAGEDPEHYDSWVDKAGEYAETTGGALADFFVAQNKKNLIDSDETKKDGQKAWEFESWVDSQENLSGDQKAYLKDNLKIWGFHAADSSKYQKGAAAGLTVDQINTASQAYSDGDSVYGNGNGSTTQGELYQAIKALGLSDKESAALYEQAKPKNWKATWYTSKRN